MKTRIKIDTTLLILIIISTGFLYRFPRLYTSTVLTDDIFDFLGLLFILKGVYLRMAARGYKKTHSKEGLGLVVGGPYLLVRNPMYLGSFLIGGGFVLIVCPWWTFLIFGFLFYFRFSRQIIKEETHLSKLFGQQYEDYTKRVSRLFPRINDFMRAKGREVLPFREAWLTKEKWGLLAWPFLGVLLDGFQEMIVFKTTDCGRIISIYIMAISIFAATMWLEYKRA